MIAAEAPPPPQDANETAKGRQEAVKTSLTSLLEREIT
jgi:hypothetical protein